MAWCMEKAKVPDGATVLDPFCGSGTTLIAALETGRKAIGVEIDSRWVDVAKRRLERWFSQPRLPFASEARSTAASFHETSFLPLGDTDHTGQRDCLVSGRQPVEGNGEKKTKYLVDITGSVCDSVSQQRGKPRKETR